MAFVLGVDAKAYHNTGTYATPVWDEIPNIRDVTVNGERGEADVTTRGGNGWRQRVGVLLDGTVEFQMVWDSEDTDLVAIQTAWLNGTLIDMAFMDGDISTTGSQGLRAEMVVLNFSRSEELENALMLDVSVAPGFSSNPPDWMIVP